MCTDTPINNHNINYINRRRTHRRTNTGFIFAENIFFIESLKTPTSKALMSRQCWKEIDM